MRVLIHLFAGLRERVGVPEIQLEDLAEGTDVAGLKRELERRYPEIGSLAAVRGASDEAYLSETEAVVDGSVLYLIPPVSGGATDSDGELEWGCFELRAEAIDPLEAQRRVAHPSCGAVLLFTGTTRCENRGQEVVRLDYEAFQALAGREMERIFVECRRRFGPESVADEAERQALRLRMLTMHRTGVVGVGEPSVVIAVASPHRDAAFAAGRYLIDELKKRVPLWKKEVYAGGHHWIGERS